MKLGLTKQYSSPKFSTMAASASCFPRKYPFLKYAGTATLQSDTALATDTYTNLDAPFSLDAFAASAFATPFPRRRLWTSNPIAPTVDTTASGLPTESRSDSRGPRTRLFDFHSTDLVHSSEEHHDGTPPSFETTVTSAPDSMRYLQTRDPTKPVPPKTVMDLPEPSPTLMERAVRGRKAAEGSPDGARNAVEGSASPARVRARPVIVAVVFIASVGRTPDVK
mmetsp:Transcript_53638/g.160588  ORF Transcript_53638/g.160588 Transcript_53638/m.160588 type:complete len:223 (+) Transcript_53638:654-1322(+)